jgi:hypothetical protein
MDRFYLHDARATRGIADPLLRVDHSRSRACSILRRAHDGLIGVVERYYSVPFDERGQ